MNALVTASFLLVGWNTYSAIIVAKDTYTGKMPGPKSIGYSIAGLAGLTAFMLYTYGIAAEKHPELLEAEGDGEILNLIKSGGMSESELTMRQKRMINRDVPEGEPMVFCVGCGEMNDGNWEWSMEACDSCFDGWMDNMEQSAESFSAEGFYRCADCDSPINEEEVIGDGTNRGECCACWACYDDLAVCNDKRDCERWEDEWDAEDREEEERMTRPEAEKLVAKVEKLVAPYVDRVEVCGSYRRGSARPGDLDVIIIPKKGVTLPDMVKAIKPSAVNWIGEKKTQVVIDGRKVDFRVSSPKGWGAALLYFTGPAGYNIGMRVRAKKQGMKLNEYGIFDRTSNQYLGGATEDEIYKVLGKTPKAPELRAEQTFGRYKPDPNRCAQCNVEGETFAVTTRGATRHFCGPICRYKYEGLAAETQTFEAPRATYTDQEQQRFEKSYNIRAKKPLNKIVKTSLGGKLPSDDSRQYYYGSRNTEMTDVTADDHKLIQGYLTIQRMAESRFTQTNSNWTADDKEYAALNGGTLLPESVKQTPYLRKAVKHYHGLAGCKTDQEMIDYINAEKMEERDFDEMLEFLRYYDITTTGPYNGIKMVATDRAPYETGGGYGNVYYHSRNPYETGVTIKTLGTYDKANKKFTLTSRDAGSNFTRLTKLRPYTTHPRFSQSTDAYIEYCTDGGYGWRSSGSQCFHLTSMICPKTNRSNQRNPEPGYRSNYAGDGWRYDIEGWEEVKSAPYRYATLVYLPTQEELQAAHGTGRELHRQTIVALYNAGKKLYATAQAQAKKEREEEQARKEKAQNLASKNEAINELENATKAMQEVIKSLVQNARNQGVPEDDIYDALETTLYDIEEMIEDWEPSDYFHAESGKSYGCKKCGTGPHRATIVEDKVFVLCPDCGLVEGSEDATAWNVTWTKDTPKVLHQRPFADVEWDTTSEE